LRRIPLLLLFAFLGCGSSGGQNGAQPADILDLPYLKEDAVEVPAPDSAGNHPPVLAPVGDRVVAVGETLTIVLSATDLDNDLLTFSVYGDVPEGAKFDKSSRTFQWVPLKAGIKVYLTFAVSDGKAMDRETIEIQVVLEHKGHPPVFEKVSDQKVQPGKPFSLQLKAKDPDGDPLTFAFVGQPPPGATIEKSTGLFNWTPYQDLDGQVVTVGFEVSDPGKLKDTMDVRFLVGDVTTGSPPQLDLPEEIAASVGKEVSFVVKASDPDKDNVQLAVESGLPEGADFDAASGLFRWTPKEADAGRLVKLTFSAYDGQFKVFGTVRILVVSAPAECATDQFESNDSPDTAKKLAPGDYDLSICDTTEHPEDIDFFLISVGQGETLTVDVTFEHAHGDIDCDLSLDGNLDTVVAASSGTSDSEHIAYKSATTRDYVLAVYGVGSEKFASAYHLKVALGNSDACDDDDYEPNDGPDQAKALTGPEATLSNLQACPDDDDWFFVVLEKGDSLLAGVTPFGPLRLDLVRPDGKTVVASDGPASSPLTVALDSADVGGTWYIRVSSASQTAKYVLELLVEKAQVQGCTPKTCPPLKVCDKATGKCVSDYCDIPDDCPVGLGCIDTYCVDPCEKASDCREGYACKSFPTGHYCGEVGTKGSGKPCTYFSECAADRVCLFQDKGGYCAVSLCQSDLDCPLDAWCVNGPGGYLCAAECKSDADCSKSAGFLCKPQTSADGETVKVCL